MLSRYSISLAKLRLESFPMSEFFSQVKQQKKKKKKKKRKRKIQTRDKKKALK